MSLANLMSLQRIPVMDCRRQALELSEPISTVISDVLQSGIYCQGPQVASFEREFAAACGVREVIGVGNGSDALEIGLRALGVEPGDEVCTVANAGGYTSFACVQVQAVPVYVDVDPSNLLLCPRSLERMLSERTRVVVVTHLFGQPCDVVAIQRVIDGRPIAILEDCAQAHGAETAMGRVGTLGSMAAFSFYPTKNLGALGDGGALATSDAGLAERTRRLRQYGWTERFHATVSGGRNSRLDELQAAILRVKLPHLERWNLRRREIINRYRAASQATSLSIVPSDAPGAVAHLCVARHPRRDEVRAALEAGGVSTGIHYPVLDPDQPALQGISHRSAELVQTRNALAQIMTLPCYPELTQIEVDHVCRQIKEVC